MRILLAIVSLVLCASCAKRVPLPESGIDFVSVTRQGENAFLDVRFSSKTDVLRFFEIHAGQNQVGNSLICSLDEAGVFETKQDLVRYFEGEVVAAKDEGSASSHVYSAEVFAVYTPDGGTLSTYISKEQVLAILKLRKVVVCKFKTAAYSYGPYYSESMDVPASAFIQAIQHKQAF
ncbi:MULTISPECIES: hypothetical protein [Pseudomonas]|uniref:Uncharacterized protein n=2 Tax=Pseudomonas TaxID=286 RepID=A0AA94ERF1_9PSED|nr:MULTISPECIES: hypothetical protein [Pseudomonas]RVD78236.1 hypothetical protein A9HBioS_2081 [Pseudomonas koreensis]WDR34196.1 hypothetical protein NN484_16930 [Pseudomonas serboccidentalis]